jgi:hypothetical protein
MENLVTLIETGKETIEKIEDMKAKIANSPTGVSFLSISNYTNKHGETSNYIINIGLNYEREKAKDIDYLTNLDLLKGTYVSSLVDLEKARTELLNSLIAPNTNMSIAQTEAYEHICENVKYHLTLDKIYAFGSKINKTILIEGNYPKTNKRALTIAKDELRKGMRTSKMRMFILDTCEVIYDAGDLVESDD